MTILPKKKATAPKTDQENGAEHVQVMVSCRSDPIVHCPLDSCRKQMIAFYNTTLGTNRPFT